MKGRNNMRIKNDVNSKSKLIIPSAIALLGILLIIFTISSLARYQSNGTADNKVRMAKWDVRLNNEPMTAGTMQIEPEITISSSPHVVEGKIAPGITGTFELEFDPGETEVAIDYLLNIDDSAVTNINNSSITLDNATFQIGSGEENTIEAIDGSINIFQPLSQVMSGEKVKVNVNLIWDDDENNTATDIQTMINNRTLQIPIAVTARQHIGGASAGDHYSITFDVNGGTGSNTTIERNTPSTIGVPTAPTKEYHTMLFWGRNSSSTSIGNKVISANASTSNIFYKIKTFFTELYYKFIEIINKLFGGII